jgi:hypothetical protein
VSITWANAPPKMASSSRPPLGSRVPHTMPPAGREAANARIFWCMMSYDSPSPSCILHECLQQHRNLRTPKPQTCTSFLHQRCQRGLQRLPQEQPVTFQASGRTENLPSQHLDALQDRQSGHFRAGARPLAWPFHLFLHIRIHLRRMKSKEPLFQKIEDGWYISGWPPSPEALPNEGELCVIDCTSEFPRTHERPYLCLPTWDTQGLSSQALQTIQIVGFAHANAWLSI